MRRRPRGGGDRSGGGGGPSGGGGEGRGMKDTQGAMTRAARAAEARGPARGPLPRSVLVTVPR